MLLRTNSFHHTYHVIVRLFGAHVTWADVKSTKIEPLFFVKKFFAISVVYDVENQFVRLTFQVAKTTRTGELFVHQAHKARKQDDSSSSLRLQFILTLELYHNNKNSNSCVIVQVRKYQIDQAAPEK